MNKRRIYRGMMLALLGAGTAAHADCRVFQDSFEATAPTTANQPPSNIALSANSVMENNANAVVGDITFTDPDAGDTHTIAVNHADFQVSNRQLIAAVAQDFETNPTVNLVITVTDCGGLSASQNVTINVTNDTSDDNSAPTDITLSNMTVPEEDFGAVVGNLSTADPDTSDTHTYAVDDNRFEVVGNQLKLKSGERLDYENETSVDVMITSTDAGGATFSKTFTLSVINDSNTAPGDISLSNNTVTENAGGAVIGTLTTADPDVGEFYTYTLSGAASDRFEIAGVNADQLKLKAGQSLDYETDLTPTFITVGGITMPGPPIHGVKLTVETSDGIDVFSKEFTIYVTDIPGELNDTGMTVSGSSTGTFSTCVDTVNAQDCSHGRDAKALAGTLVKSPRGGGRAGFDFIKINTNGGEMQPTATGHACVKDNVTGLLWEVKTDNGLHNADNTYTWYNTDSTNNGGISGMSNGGTCSGGGNCDTAGFVTAVNAVGLCGKNDWRLPTREELRGIVDYSLGRLDPAFFPNIPSGFVKYWTATPSVNNQNLAWVMESSSGDSIGHGKTLPNHVRLVSGGQ